MRWFKLVVLILATQRLTSLWFEEVATPVRTWLVARTGRWAYLASCRLCISVWAAAVLLGTWVSRYSRPVVWVLAISSGALVLETCLAAFLNGRR